MNPYAVSIGLMVPYPGTEIFEMAQKGDGGYKLLSRDWRVYNKQFGDALELDGLTRKKLEKLQVFGYFKLYFYNFRFIDLLKIIFENRKLVIKMSKKIFIEPLTRWIK